MKRKLIASVCVAILFGMCGCENTIPQLSAEAEGQIVNYAADVALKYDASYDNRLVDLSLYEDFIQKESEVESESGKEENKGMDPVEDKETVDVSEDKGYHSSIEEFFGYDEIEILFVDAYFADSYSENDANDYFALDAKAGKKLLVMNFEVTNKSEMVNRVDFLSVSSQMKISLNGDREVKILSTMLTNDLSTFAKSMEANETVMLVLLAEVTEDKATEILNLDISLKSESATAKILLK